MDKRMVVQNNIETLARKLRLLEAAVLRCSGEDLEAFDNLHRTQREAYLELLLDLTAEARVMADDMAYGNGTGAREPSHG